jgi:uncharacterized protein (UPF0212 family)
MKRRVTLEAGVRVYDVETMDESLQIAISKVGDMLNPDLNYVEIEAREETPAIVVAGEALVALELEMITFDIEDDEHATKVAQKEIGQRLNDIPLEVVSVEEVEDEDKETTEE